MAWYLKMALFVPFPCTSYSYRFYSILIKTCAHTSTLGHMLNQLHDVCDAILISNTGHNIDHQRNHPCDAQNAIALISTSPSHRLLHNSHHPSERDLVKLAETKRSVIGQRQPASSARQAPAWRLPLCIRAAFRLHNFSSHQASATVRPRTASCPGTMQIFVKTRELKTTPNMASKQPY